MTKKDQKIEEVAKHYALACHNTTNHKYNDKAYGFHLQMVVDTAKQFIHLIPEAYRGSVLAGCWVHDVIEDCRQTYNDVKEATSETVAELAYALTNEKGKNRKERGSLKYYYGIRETPYATFIKCCDRIANSQYSKDINSGMLKMYRKENAHFEFELRSSYGDNDKYAKLFDHLSNILDQPN